MATQFKIIYEDTETTVKVKPKHILKAERSGHAEASAEATYWLAWAASDSPLSFDEWIELVDEIEPIFEDDKLEEELPPTRSGSRGSRSAQA